MARAMLLVLLLAGPAVAMGVSPVQKVIQLIDDMHAKVTKEAQEESKVFEEYAKFCDDEATAKDYAIKDSKDAIEGLGATIIDSNAVIETEGSKVGDLTARISDVEGEMATSLDLRAKEKDAFVKTEKELVQTTEELSGAQKAIKKSMAFIQARGGKVNSEDREVLNAVVQTLGQIVEASFVTQKQKDHIASLLQDREDSAEDAEFMSGTTNVNAILDTLGEMEDKAEQSLTEARKAESEAQQNSAMLKQGLENEVKNANQEKGESTQKSAATTQALAQAEKDLAVEKDGLSKDEAYVRDLKRDCQSKAADFEVEARDNQAELKALASAKAILAKKFASLVQTGSQARAMTRARDEDPVDEAKARALRMIEQLGHKLGKTALVALAYRASEDPFGKIRGMVEEMIAKLLQEAANEATQKAFCDKEIGESKASQEGLEGKLGKVNARLETASSSTSTLSEDISKLSGEVAESDASVAKATEIRQKEKSEFMVVEKDLSESQEACAAAIQVLREYYEGASLLQVSARSQNRAEEVSEAEGDGSGILGVLEVAESDFAKGLAEARTVEQQAQSEYDQMAQDAKMLKMTKEMEIKGKESESKSLKMTTSDLSSDKEGLTGELDAVLAYLDKLKPQCETKVPSYAEVKAAREAEIEGLKNALEVLQPSLLQTSGDALLQTGVTRQLRRAA